MRSRSVSPTSRIALAVFGLLVVSASAMRAAVLAPAITEPERDGQVISPYDVHMVAGPFLGSPGETHVCSDWQLVADAETVWSASCVTGALAVHIHLGDGTFEGSLAGRHELEPDRDYRLRVRFAGSGISAPDWGPWSERLFHTQPATAVEPMVMSDVSVVPTPTWRDDAGHDVVLSEVFGEKASLALEVPGLGLLLRIDGFDAASNTIENPSPLPGHGAVRLSIAAGSAPLSIPASTLAFTDGGGNDRVVALPSIALDPGQAVAYWLSAVGEAYRTVSATGESLTPLDWTARASAVPAPWALEEPGFHVERVATGFRLPVEIAFVPSPADGDDAPLYYVSELYGSIRVVSRGGTVSTYADGLLNFDPLASFPGAGEKGTTGIAVDPGSGDVFVGTLEAQPGVTDYHFPMVVRLHSTDGGRTASSRTTILDFPDEPVGPSHQISNVTIGPDGMLYVHIGDGLLTTPAQDPASVRGKILRVNLDGSAPTDNPFYAAGGPLATNLIYALGFRNPFGGAWRAADGAHWEVENGPNVDRLAKVVAGRNYLWDGTDASMANFAAYVWPISVAPVNIAFVQPASFSGSGFPAERQDHAFVTESGATFAPGPQAIGKRISEFVFDADGTLVAGPLPFLRYVGGGRGTAAALAAGPDGLYFSDLFRDFHPPSAADPGASVFRIRYVGIADFTASAASGAPPLEVRFRDASSVPGASAWHWDFGDGASSDEPNPTHRYAFPGAYDVRLTVTGTAGPVARQRASFVTIASPPRRPSCCFVPEPPRRLPAR